MHNDVTSFAQCEKSTGCMYMHMYMHVLRLSYVTLTILTYIVK